MAEYEENTNTHIEPTEDDERTPSMGEGSDHDQHSSPEEKEPWYSSLAWKFIGFAMISAVVTLGIMAYANYSLHKSHETIILQHEKSMILTNSLLEQCTKIKNDSSNNLLGNKLLAKQIEDAAGILAKQENDQKILHILELEFAKIQNEYEVLNLWCALLTVVFLIFSFFSLIKTNELARQGEEALTNLKATALEAETKTTSIDEKVKEAEDIIQKSEKNLIENFEKSIEETMKPLTKEKEELSQSIKEEKENLKSLEEKTASILQEIDKRIKEIKDAIPDVISEIIVREARNLINSELKRITFIEKRIDEFSKRLDRAFGEKEDKRFTGDSMVEDIEGIEKKEDIDEDDVEENPNTK